MYADGTKEEGNSWVMSLNVALLWLHAMPQSDSAPFTWMPLCLVLQGEEDALPRDIHALKMQATHTFGSNRIFAASDFFTYQVQIPLLATYCSQS